MRVFLGAHRAGFALVWIEQAGLLIDAAAAFDDLDLASRFVFNRLLHEPEGVHVLDLAAGPKLLEVTARAELLIGARFADRHVHIGAQIALLHVAVTRAERDNDGFQLLHIGRRLKRGAHIRLGHDFHQRHARAVKVHISGIRRHVVDRLAGILLKMKPFNPHREGIGRIAMGWLNIDLDLALTDDREFKLADLIALRQIGIEIVLPVKARVFVDLRLEAQSGADRLFDAFAIDHRQHARHRRIDQRDVAIGIGPERG